MIGGFRCKTKIILNETFYANLKHIMTNIFEKNISQMIDYLVSKDITNMDLGDKKYSRYCKLLLVITAQALIIQYVKMIYRDSTFNTFGNYQIMEGSYKLVFFDINDNNVYAIEMLPKNNIDTDDINKNLDYDFIKHIAVPGPIKSELLSDKINLNGFNEEIVKKFWNDSHEWYVYYKDGTNKNVIDTKFLFLYDILKTYGDYKGEKNIATNATGDDITKFNNAIINMLSKRFFGQNKPVYIDGTIKDIVDNLQVNFNSFFNVYLKIYPNYGYTFERYFCNEQNLLKRFMASFYVVIYLLYTCSKLHENGKAHCDIKYNNILVGNYKIPGQDHIALIDFGLSQNMQKHYINTRNYLDLNNAPSLTTLNMLNNKKNKILHSNIDAIDLDIHSIGLMGISLLLDCKLLSEMYNSFGGLKIENIDKFELINKKIENNPNETNQITGTTISRSFHNKIVSLTKTIHEFERKLLDTYSGIRQLHLRSLILFILELCDYGFSKSVRDSTDIFQATKVLYNKLKTICEPTLDFYKHYTSGLLNQLNHIAFLPNGTSYNFNGYIKLPEEIYNDFFPATTTQLPQTRQPTQTKRMNPFTTPSKENNNNFSQPTNAATASQPRRKLKPKTVKKSLNNLDE